MINTFSSKNVPVIIDQSGETRFLTNFSLEAETESYYSCSVNFQNEMYMFGGIFIKDQISKLTNCSLSRVGSLDFDFNGGGCANFNNQKIVLCFDYYEKKQCWTAETALGTFKRTSEAKYDHKLIRIAASQGKDNNYRELNRPAGAKDYIIYARRDTAITLGLNKNLE